MNIFEILRYEHRSMKDMVARLKAPVGLAPWERQRLFEKLKVAIEDHASNEETFFYPVLADTDEVLELSSREEHEQIDQLMSELEDWEVGTTDWYERLEDLERALFAHVEMEEEQVFLAAQRCLGPADAERLGHWVVMASDWRPAAGDPRDEKHI